ncbi:hypothetical protein GCM10023185_21940 [Hymenobacter saemangeumensis]|uniref:Uncharacterized protein n=1 Tax=Hymenobacter saemangeumensis TaxID=1084522 RepID=A0ABP8IEL9_9BACT
MENQESVATPSTWAQAGLLWLFTNTIGSLSCFALMTRATSDGSSGDSGFIAALIAIFAGLGSLFVIPIAVFTFRRLLAMPGRQQRLPAAGAAVAGLFVIPCLVLFIGLGTASALAVYMGGWVYLPAALLSAAVVYHRGLFRPDTPAQLPVTHG